jgi:hypothetical protein
MDRRDFLGILIGALGAPAAELLPLAAAAPSERTFPAGTAIGISIKDVTQMPYWFRVVGNGGTVALPEDFTILAIHASAPHDETRVTLAVNGREMFSGPFGLKYLGNMPFPLWPPIRAKAGSTIDLRSEDGACELTLMGTIPAPVLMSLTFVDDDEEEYDGPTDEYGS